MVVVADGQMGGGEDSSLSGLGAKGSAPFRLLKPVEPAADQNRGGASAGLSRCGQLLHLCCSTCGGLAGQEKVLG